MYSVVSAASELQTSETPRSESNPTLPAPTLPAPSTNPLLSNLSSNSSFQKDFRITFSFPEAGVSRLVDPEAVLADEEGGVGGKRRGKMTAAGGKGGCKRRGKTVSARGKGGGKMSGKTAAVSDEGGKMSGRKAVGSKGGRGGGVGKPTGVG